MIAHNSATSPAQTTDLRPIRRALLSVTDKTGLVDFARALVSHNVELVSTGGTSKALRDAGLTVRDISDLTGFPEMLDGRVKTLHPKVHGGILHIRGNAEHVAAVKAHAIEPIDMVVVNLYAFEKTSQRPGVAFGDVIENIDIGGPSMVRSAAKNFEDVAIVTATADYSALAEELAANSGSLSRNTRWRLAKQAFAVTAAYDAGIATALESIVTPSGPAIFSHDDLPSTLRVIGPLAKSLRYGENPHQKAALYIDGSGKGVAAAQQLQGKELSYNNIVDLDASWELVSEFDSSSEAAVVIIKHTNPCGASAGATVLEAYRRALEADPVSAFGGVIGARSMPMLQRRSPSSSSKLSSRLPSHLKHWSASPPRRTCASSRSSQPTPHALSSRSPAASSYRMLTVSASPRPNSRSSLSASQRLKRCGLSCSPGASASTSNRTPSSTPASPKDMARPSASAQGR